MGCSRKRVSLHLAALCGKPDQGATHLDSLRIAQPGDVHPRRIALLLGRHGDVGERPRLSSRVLRWGRGTHRLDRRQCSGLAVQRSWGLGGADPLRFSGWLAEAFVIPRFVHAPLLLIWIIPLSIVSYLLLILPGMAVVGRYLPQPSVDRERRVRSYLAAILVPVGCSAWRGDLHGALLQAVTGIPLLGQ